MSTTILRVLFILIYLVIVSQGLFYLLALSKAASALSMAAFAELRVAVDSVIDGRLKVLYNLALIIGIVILFMSWKSSSPLLILTSTLALVCIIADVFLALKFNEPINSQFYNYTSENTTVDWEALRAKWLQFLEYRAYIMVTGFLSLLAGFVWKN